MTQQQHSCFANLKATLLAGISSSGPDASPKGSVDVQILPLINRLNEHPKVITTSSCSGRISVFVEGFKKPIRGDSGVIGKDFKSIGTPEIPSGNAGMGGKGGGRWLFVSHDPVDCNDKAPEEVRQLLLGGHIVDSAPENNQILSDPVPSDTKAVILNSTRFVHIKFEPMILHIQTRDLKTAHIILAAALSAGFRESGIMNPGLAEHSFPMVAVRCHGLAMDSIIGIMNGSDPGINMIVNDNYLKTMVLVSSLRFEDNKRRIAAFTDKIESVLFDQGQAGLKESKEERKLRKREEGLKRQRIIKATQASRENEPLNAALAQNNARQ